MRELTSTGLANFNDIFLMLAYVTDMEDVVSIVNTECSYMVSVVVFV